MFLKINDRIINTAMVSVVRKAEETTLVVIGDHTCEFTGHDLFDYFALDIVDLAEFVAYRDRKSVDNSNVPS